ncbi:uncharacterized protein EHS24_004157 [Apiotrichum porosum]|uniref:ATP synthase subunit J, mitochondrial n=1 Tax=Apiotrichum porosum TaxID=105984 RepID=A0A427Y4F0_9TREE|nr:uncharacterized protein EHS24_004157 [Apiotrichum porosum]RSH85970.1 hypothetical protein EHS24_004157 [Apiotrichum porosum]
MFGLRKWPTPMAAPLWPFAFASVVTFFGVVKAQGFAVATPDAIKDPRNPYAAQLVKQEAH